MAIRSIWRAAAGAAITAITFVAPAAAQTAPDRAAILAAVHQLYDGMNTRDTAMMAAAVHPEAVTVGVSYRDGRTLISAGGGEVARLRIARSRLGPQERILGAEVWQDGDVAAVWAPYEVRHDGGLLACGTNAIELARREGRWAITGAAYTLRREGCPPVVEATPAARDSVLAAVERFFAILRTRDTAGLRRALSTRAAWTTASYGARGPVVARRPASADIAMLAGETEPLNERLTGAVVRVDGDIALVWGPYRFEIGDRLSHCGYDGFRLVREEGRWLLEGGVYTVRPEGCER